MIRKLLRAVRRLWRSSVTGRFVSRDFAEAHPDTTQQETLRDEGDAL
jgi:hypothetical protein